MTDDSDSGAADEANGSVFDISRRHIVGGVAGIAVGGVVGTGYALLGDDGGGGQSISATEPDDDGEASLAELHYILENSGPENARVNVTGFRYYEGDDVIEITYESSADSSDDVSQQHLRELEQVMFMFAEYVRQDGNNGDEQGSVLRATISNPAPSQAEGYEIRREWVRKYNADEWSGSRTLSVIVETEYGGDESSGNASENTSAN